MNNIETVTQSKTSNTELKTSSNVQTKALEDNAKTFKDELENVKEEKMNITTSQKTTNSATDTNAQIKSQISQENSQGKENSFQNELANQSYNPKENSQIKNQTQIEQQTNIQNIKQTKEKTTTQNTDLEAENKDPFSELSEKIQIVSKISKNKSLNSEKTLLGTIKTTDKDYCSTIKMEKQDVSFFLNLVENHQANAQAAQNNSLQNNLNLSDFANNTNNSVSASAKSAQVSTVLMDALQNSMNTNKPIRIDFDNNIAVIMKVDKDGVLSANFIPGDAAVEQYLRNNIANLRQSFDNQNLSYNELTYTKQQNRQQKDKEKENE